MAQDITSAEASSLKTAVVDYSVDTQNIDGAAKQKETTWTNDNWTQWLGYYKTIPELQSVIDTKATYTIGKGFKADTATTEILNKIVGWGKDTFNTILENMLRVNQIGGDAYSEIIKNKSGSLLNLKPLDPGVMRHVVNGKGMILRFEQLDKIGGKEVVHKFKSEEIFYLPRNRIADEIHGISIIEKLEETILMRAEAMLDMKKLMHRHIKPFNIFKLDTDDTTKIAAFKAKQDAIAEEAENMYIPLGAVEVEQFAMPKGATDISLAWIEQLNNYFYQATGVPKVLMGDTSGTTEAGTKMGYFAFQQRTEEDQKSIEEQVKIQLGLEIELEPPASLEKNLAKDETKDGSDGAKPNDTTAEMEGNK